MSDRKFVLVTGCPRSGTTAMGLWLASQKDIHGATESRRTIVMHAMLREARRFACFHPPNFGTRTTRMDLATTVAGRATLELYGDVEESKVILADKEPLEPVALPHEDYVGYLTDVRAALDAKLLCMVRSPVNTVASMVKRKWGFSLTEGEPASFALQRCIDIWKRATRAVIRMSIVEPEATRVQCYEVLCAEPARESEEISRWLGYPLYKFPVVPARHRDLDAHVMAETEWERRLLAYYDERPPSEPAICLLTGEPGVGKTTIALQVAKAMEGRHWRVVVLDGDELRERLWPDLKYDPDGRVKSMRRATALALNIARAGAVVLIAMVAPYENERRAAQDRAACVDIPFHVVRVKAHLDLRLERRPDKKVHDVGYEEPIAPTLVVDTSHALPSEAACSVLRLLEDVT